VHLQRKSWLRVCGAVTDGLTFSISKAMTFYFSHRPSDYCNHSHHLRLSRSSFVQCCCKFIRKKSRLSLFCHPGGPFPHPL